MAIRVRFDKHGWHHPAFGRLGRGKGAGTIYTLPDQFGETETVKVPVMDNTSRPPRQVGEKEITRFRYLPSTVEIIDDEKLAEIVEQAEDEGETPPKVVKPRRAEGEKLPGESVPGRGKTPAPQSAVERTTGRRRSRRAAATE